MVDLLLAMLAVTVLGALGLVALAGVTVVPFVLALQQGDKQGLSAGRVGAFTAGCVLAGLAVAGAIVVSGRAIGLVLPALLLTWAGPLALRELYRPGFLGRSAQHE